MAFLRVAAFDVEDAPDEALDLWDDLMGSALRNHPDCESVTAARNENRFLVITRWTSSEAFAAATASKPLQDLQVTIAARLNMPADQEPTFLFESEI